MYADILGPDLPLLVQVYDVSPPYEKKYTVK